MAPNTPLYGLLLAGGESVRMGSPKHSLNYHGVPELERMHQLLSAHCVSVYIGCREEQLVNLPETYLPICDLPPFAGNGPIGSILSAWTVFPDVDWLVAGCDYPFFHQSAIGQLLSASADESWSGFVNASTGSPEPLLGIYRTPLRATLFEAFRDGARSLRAILESLPVNAATPADPQWIRSVDTLDAYRKTLQTINA